MTVRAPNAYPSEIYNRSGEGHGLLDGCDPDCWARYCKRGLMARPRTGAPRRARIETAVAICVELRYRRPGTVEGTLRVFITRLS